MRKSIFRFLLFLRGQVHNNRYIYKLCLIRKTLLSFSSPKILPNLLLSILEWFFSFTLPSFYIISLFVWRRNDIDYLFRSLLLFQRFSIPPSIYVTVRHQILKRPQDALALWVEDVRRDSFKVCLRETKIFDGLHKNIKVVRQDAATYRGCALADPVVPSALPSLFAY